MKYQDFWSLVEKHPWLPRVLFLLWELLERDPPWPHAIHDCLSPKALERVKIVFLQWEDLDLKATLGNCRDDGEGVDGRRMPQEVSISHDVYCHRPETPDLPFTLRISNQEPIYNELTVQELMGVVQKRGCVVDAVVKLTRIVELSRPHNLTEALIDLVKGGDYPETNIYEIYRPPF